MQRDPKSGNFRGSEPNARPSPPVAGMRRSGSASGNPASISPDLSAKRVELILQQLEALPTLGTVAMRVLELTSDDDSRIADIVRLVSSDPSLSAKVIRLCRCHERGRAYDISTVDRAVKVLGFEALRSAVLSVQAFEVFDRLESPAGERRSQTLLFDRMLFWQHSLAVAMLCETLADRMGPRQGIAKGDAFLAGLLHDLGALALHVLLPQTFDRVCKMSDAGEMSLDQACRRAIGLDTHTVGRRLAEHWRLPHAIGDVLWLHGQRLDSVPPLPHRAQIALVGLADIVARSRGIAPPGHGPRGEDAQEFMDYLNLNAAQLDEATQFLADSIDDRCEMLGIKQPLDHDALLTSIGKANVALGRINADMREQSLLAQRQTQTLHAITQFYDSAAPGGSVVDVMGKVVESAAAIFEGGFFAILYQARINDHWQFIQFAPDGRPIRSELIAPPRGSTAVADLADDTQVSMQVMAMLPWVSDYVGDSRDLRQVQLLPLRCGWGVNAVLLHDCPIDGRERREQLAALGRTWAAAIAAGAQHEGAKRLGEQLAESNRALIEAQDELARSQALAALGEIAAGAAHEMNNPLTVISGRSQLLANTLSDPSAKAMAQQIVEQSHRISDMITALREFAEPTQPDIQPVDVQQLLDTTVAEVARRFPSPPPIKVVVPQGLPFIHVDPRQMSRAVAELLRNAVESETCAHVEVRVQIDPVNDRLMILVTDDGSGLTHHALAHAFDPFFSSKPAGRQPGLGLAQARRLVEAHGGQITLENGRHRGAIATIRLNQWRAGANESPLDSSQVHHRGAA